MTTAMRITQDADHNDESGSSPPSRLPYRALIEQHFQWARGEWGR